MRVADLLEVRIDNVNGMGSVPDNQDIDYKGLRVLMRPRDFFDLSAFLDRTSAAKKVDNIKRKLEAGAGIGAPFLVINIPNEWHDGDLTNPARVVGHEGRHRMYAVQEMEGDSPIEVHLFFRGDLRRRHIKPEWIERMNKGMVPEKLSFEHKGPFFELAEGSMKLKELEAAKSVADEECEECTMSEADLEEVYPGQSSGRLKNYVRKKYGGEISCRKVASLMNDPDVNNFYKKRAAWYKSLHCKGGKQVR